MIVLEKIRLHKIFRWIWVITRLVLLVGLSFMILYPIFVKFMTSIKSAGDLADPSIIFLPKHPTFNTYEIVFNAVGYPKTLLFTVLFTSMISLIQISSCIFVAYGLARFRFWGRKLVFGMTILTLIVPPQTMLLPLYFRFKYFSFLNLFKLWGNFEGIDFIDTIIPFLLLSATAVAFKNGLYIFLLRQYFKNMPFVLEEAAYIDGCGPFKTFYRIMIPGALPMILTVFLLSFVWQWNDTYYTQTLSPNISTLSNKMFGMVFHYIGTGSDIINQFLESSKFFLLVSPLVVLYIFTQRFFTESIEKSGIVG